MLTEATACLYTTGSCERTRTSLQARTTRGAPAGTSSHHRRGPQAIPGGDPKPPRARLPRRAPAPRGCPKRPPGQGRATARAARPPRGGGSARLPVREAPRGCGPAPKGTLGGPATCSPALPVPVLTPAIAPRGAARRAERRGWLPARRAPAAPPPAGGAAGRGREENGPPGRGPTACITNKAADNWRAGGARLSLRRMAVMARGQPGSGAGSRTEAAAGSGPRVPSPTQKPLGSRAGGAAL